MPDLDVQYFYHCVSTEFWEVRTGNYTVTYDKWGHKNPGVMHDYSCTCKAYRFAKRQNPVVYCKHILRERRDHCRWMEFVDGGKPKDDKCPKCGSKVLSQGWAV